MKKADKKALKQDYRELVGAVTQALNEWDPYDLIQSGAPANEFIEEATKIAAKIKSIETPAELAEVISEVFSTNFENNLFPVEACLPVASRMFDDLEARGLLK
jgi:hypothetical protein